MNVTLSTEERTSETLSSAHLDQAVSAIRKNGYVMLEDIVSHDNLDQLSEQMDRNSPLLRHTRSLPPAWSISDGQKNQ